MAETAHTTEQPRDLLDLYRENISDRPTETLRDGHDPAPIREVMGS